MQRAVAGDDHLLAIYVACVYLACKVHGFRWLFCGGVCVCVYWPGPWAVQCHASHSRLVTSLVEAGTWVAC